MKELPNDGFETSRGALWLGIGTFLVLSWGITGLLVQDRNRKIETAPAMVSKHPGAPC